MQPQAESIGGNKLMGRTAPSADKEKPPRPRIRRARPADAAALSRLAYDSKASWGYDDAFMEACRDKTENALSVLDECMNDGNASWRDRTSAAALLLEHGHGKPVDRVAVANLNGNRDSKDFNELSTQELLQIIADETRCDEAVNPVGLNVAQPESDRRTG